MEALYRVLDALSCYLSLILKHFDTKRDLEEKKLGGRLLRPRLDAPLQGRNTQYLNFGKF